MALCTTVPDVPVGEGGSVDGFVGDPVMGDPVVLFLDFREEIQHSQKFCAKQVVLCIPVQSMLLNLDHLEHGEVPTWAGKEK